MPRSHALKQSSLFSTLDELLLQLLMFPSTPKRHQLTRDEHLRIQTLYEAGWKFDAIHAHLRPYIQGLSLRQIEYTCQFTHPTPQKRSGRPPLLTDE
jgi:hypothetical protein